jgi:tetratricopeptide (TPR) repeat protein
VRVRLTAWGGRAVLGFGLALAGRPPIVLCAQATDQDEHYRDCVQLSQRAPDKAYDDAVAWQKEGGGGGARHCAALALVGMGRYEEAATVLQQLAEDVETSETASPLAVSSSDALRADLLSQSGNAWLMAKQYVPARDVLTKALTHVAAQSPVARDIHIDRARAYAGSGDFGQALNDLDTAAEIDPARAEIYVYRASALRQTHQIDLADKDIETAIKLDPDDAAALLERGYIRQIQKNYAGARADWKRVADMQSGSALGEQAEKNLATLGSDEPPAQDASHSPSTSGSVSPPK